MAKPRWGGALVLLGLTLTAKAASFPVGSPASVQLAPAALRTAEQMQLDELSAARPAIVQRVFRPTLALNAYLTAKAHAQANVGGRKDALQAPATTIPSLLLSREGVNQTTAGGWYPPDSEGAIGHTHFVQTVNNHIDMYDRASPTPNLLKSLSLNSFIGYARAPLFDARIVYDPKWKRWIFGAPAFEESPGVQYFFLAVSMDQNPTHAWYVYSWNVAQTGSASFMFDYPQLGFDNDAVLLTANLFDPEFVGAYAGTMAKSLLYNGLGGAWWYWTGLEGTLAPPIVRDQWARTFFAAAPPNGRALTLYTMTDSSRSPPHLAGPFYVTAAAYSVPPPAPQPGTQATLDTLDNRFVSSSAQKSNDLWQVHCVALGAAALRWYRINTDTLTVAQSGDLYASTGSSDFNGSITANSGGAFICWSSVDARNGINAQIRFSGKLNAESTISAGDVLWTSPTFLSGNAGLGSTVQRWGDYSAISIDPLNGARAWIINEKINDANTWGTRFGQISF